MLASRLLDRPVPRPLPRRRDVVTAALCWAVGLGVLFAASLMAGVDPELSGEIAGQGSATWWVMVCALTGQAVALAGVRAAPGVVLPLVAAIALAVSWIGLGGAFGVLSLAIIAATYLAFTERPQRVRRSSGLSAAALTLAAYIATGLQEAELSSAMVVAGAFAQAAFVVGAPMLVALLVSSRRDIREATDRAVRALAREHDALVREARAQERTAMARELHDIAAHHLSGIAVMAAAIER